MDIVWVMAAKIQCSSPALGFTKAVYPLGAIDGMSAYCQVFKISLTWDDGLLILPAFNTETGFYWDRVVSVCRNSRRYPKRRSPLSMALP